MRQRAGTAFLRKRGSRVMTCSYLSSPSAISAVEHYLQRSKT